MIGAIKYSACEDYIDTPISKTHALAECFIYHRSARQPAQAESAVSDSYRPQSSSHKLRILAEF